MQQQSPIEMFDWRERDLCAYRPALRGGHTVQCLRLSAYSAPNLDSAAHQSNQTLLVFGGSDPYGVSYNDIFAIEVPPARNSSEGWRCTELQPSNSGGVAPPRMNATSCTVPTSRVAKHQHSQKQLIDASDSAEAPAAVDRSLDSMIVFGGCQAVPHAAVFNDVFCISLHPQWSELCGTWRAPKLLYCDAWSCSGEVPLGRHSHSSAVVDNVMLVVGGSGDGGRLFDDCFALCMDNLVWREITVTPPLPAREMGSMVALPLEQQRGTSNSSSPVVVVAGGRAANGDLLSSVSILTLSSASETFSTATATCGGPLTEPRCCHTLLAVGSTCALCVGGFAASGSTTDELVISSRDTAVVVAPIARYLKHQTRQHEAVVVGFGHSSCSWRDSMFSWRHVVLSGLVPNAASGTLQVFEVIPVFPPAEVS